jgi:hypothetical protein
LWYRPSRIRERERLLAAEMESIKVAGEAAVGFELLEPGARSDDLDGLLRFVRAKLDHAEEYFALPGEITYNRSGQLVTFESRGASSRDSPNNLAIARLFEARRRDRAVVVLPYWNSQRHELAAFGRMLAACGITCLQLSLPYHDERRTRGAGFAREMACENLGLTLLANRQAILDARACLAWLDMVGYRRLGIVGLSIGASVASIVAALDQRVAAVALLLMADDFAQAVWTGSATRHVRQSLQRRFTLDAVRGAWALVSPASYADRLARRLDHVLIVSGDLDTVFIPELAQRYVDRLRRSGGDLTWVRLGCGHYTLGLPRYALRTFFRTLIYLRARL